MLFICWYVKEIMILIYVRDVLLLENIDPYYYNSLHIFMSKWVGTRVTEKYIEYHLKDFIL